MASENTTLRPLASLVLLYAVYLNPIMLPGSPLVSYLYIYGIPLLYLLFHWRHGICPSQQQVVVIATLTLLFALSLLYPLAHGTGDYSYTIVTTYVFRKSLIYLFLILVSKRRHRGQFDSSYFMYYYAAAQAAYVIGTLVMVFVPRFKQSWFSVFGEAISYEQYSDSYGYTFRIGWQGFSGFGLTISCSLACIFLMYLRYARSDGLRLSTVQFLVPLSLCFLGNMFYGRSGLVVSIFACLSSLFIWNRRCPMRIIKMLAMAALALFAIYSIRDIPALSTWYTWMSQPIINLFTRGTFDNVSISATHDMVFTPPQSTILLGDGYYTVGGSYYMHTDSGIMRNILFWGVLGFVLSYGMTVWLIINLKNLHGWMLPLLLIGALAAFEYKGHMYFEIVALTLALFYADGRLLFHAGGEVLYGNDCQRCNSHV